MDENCGTGLKLGTRKESILPISITLWARYTRHPNAPYICRFGYVTDEYRTHIFTVMWLNRRIYGAAKVKPNSPYIHRFLAQTNEYNLTFIGFGIDEYNSNIFIGTDEFKTPMNESLFPIVYIVRRDGMGPIRRLCTLTC
jgi:hypothetical protein